MQLFVQAAPWWGLLAEREEAVCDCYTMCADGTRLPGAGVCLSASLLPLSRALLCGCDGWPVWPRGCLLVSERICVVALVPVLMCVL